TLQGCGRAARAAGSPGPPPPIRGPFERLEVAESPWGPVLGGSRPRAACRLTRSTPGGHAERVGRGSAQAGPPRGACRLPGLPPVGYAELVEGVIEQLELPDLEDPLAYLHGRYRSVRELPDHGCGPGASALSHEPLTSVGAPGGPSRYRGPAEVHVLLRNPQVELVPCRRRHYGAGV